MPIFAPLESPPESVLGVEVGDWVAAEPVCEAPREEAADAGVVVEEGVGDGVNRTPIFAASETAFSEGKRDKSDSSHATYSGSAKATPLDNVEMLETVDLSMTCS
jgi:predicted mannosyl-3-phosphoglycerate phosphatase (HAD superfamily)